MPKNLSRSPFGQSVQPAATIPGFRNVVHPASQYFPSLINSQPLGATAGVNYDRATAAMADYLRSFGAQPTTTASSGGAVPSSIGPINLLKVSKGGGFDEYSQNALARISGATPNYGDISSRINTALTPSADEQANRADTEALIARYRAAAPGLTATTQGQADTLNLAFAPESDPNSLAGRLAANRVRARGAERQAARQAGSQALLAYQFRNATEGTSSTNAALLADLTARNAVDIAARSAERERADIGNVLSAQERIAGRPQDLVTSDILSGQIPIQARRQLIEEQVRLAASRLQNLGIEVNLRTLTDELTTLGRQLGLSGQALQQYLAANFTGLDTPSQGLIFPRIGGGTSEPERYGGPNGQNRQGGGNPPPYLPPAPPPNYWTPDSDASLIHQAQARAGLTSDDVAAMQDYFLNPELYPPGPNAYNNPDAFRQAQDYWLNPDRPGPGLPPIYDE